MKNKLTAGMAAQLIVMAAALAGVAFSSSDADAQSAEKYEYGYMLPVARLESYDVELKRWAGSADDKQYLKSRVFVYEEGSTAYERQINSLRLFDQISENGWELVDAQVGVIRRKR